MALYTGCIFSSSRSVENGLRASIMSRHTRNDGKRLDERIIEGVSFDVWWREYAPPLRLIGSYVRGEINFKQFEYSFINHLRTEEMRAHLRRLADIALERNVILLCRERDASVCHRRLVGEECVLIEPSLPLIHLPSNPRIYPVVTY